MATTKQSLTIQNSIAINILQDFSWIVNVRPKNYQTDTKIHIPFVIIERNTMRVCVIQCTQNMDHTGIPLIKNQPQRRAG